MMHRIWKKASFAELFTVISLTVIGLITVSASVVFFISFRSMSYSQIETDTRKKVVYMRDIVVANFNKWASLIKYTAIGSAPFMSQEPVNEQALQELFKDIVASQSDIWLIYCSNNLVWNEPGGYAVYGNGTIPAPDWNNTQRAWFTSAKKAAGEVGYSEPYIAASNGTLIISVSINVYDESGTDVGVVSGNVSIAFLNDILAKNSSQPGQQTYLLNRQGLFIANPDRSAVLHKDYFVESGLERYRDAVLSSESFFKMDRKVFIYAVFIPEVDWLLVSTIPTPVIFAKANSLLIKLILVNLLLI
ncbi:MAG: cache domain-containing protein, partial [Treponema sp.]|nr:cache domain-containing protein [Treponema sp.]